MRLRKSCKEIRDPGAPHMPDHSRNDRLEAFADAIFAIAITLLILEIHVPPVESIHSAQDLLRDVLSSWPSWFAFLLTFVTLFIAWVNHYHTVAQLDKTSPPFIYANGLLLLTVVIFPFSASMLGRFLDSPFRTLPIVMYCATTLLHNASWLLVFTTALVPRDLSKDAASARRIRATRRLLGWTLAFNALVCVAAVWFPVPSLTVVTLAWLYYLRAGVIRTPLG